MAGTQLEKVGSNRFLGPVGGACVAVGLGLGLPVIVVSSALHGFKSLHPAVQE